MNSRFYFAKASFICIFSFCIFHAKGQPGGFINPIIDLSFETSKVKPALDSVSATKAIRVFNFTVPNHADYKMKFWILPSKLSNNSYSTYNVTIDNTITGQLNTSTGNWQYLTMVDSLVELSAGNHQVQVSCSLPEVPEIEFVNVYNNGTMIYDYDSLAIKDSQVYYNYHSIAVEGALMSPNIGYLQGGDEGDQGLALIPSYYTFYKKYYFLASQTINFMSTSPYSHVLDFFEAPTSPNQIKSCNFSKIATSIPSMNNPNVKMAGLSVTIPKNGFYMVRLRSSECWRIAEANLNVNGFYYFDSVPISYCKMDVSVPTGENRMSVVAIGKNSTTDPMLFIEGGGTTPGKVKFFNDDTSIVYLCDQLLAAKDAALIYENITAAPTSVSWCNYSSAIPIDTCDVYVHYGEDTYSSRKGFSVLESDDEGRLEQEIKNNANNSPAIISIYDMNGMLIAREAAMVSDVNDIIRRTCVKGTFCIVRISTTEGNKVRKIYLKQ